MQFSYKLTQPNYMNNTTFSINSTNTIDLIAISDLHIDNFELDLRRLNNVYDYCAKNNIQTIANLGDLFNFVNYNKNMKHANFKSNYDLLTKALKKLPYDKNIYHLIMGGNHDKLIPGIDPIRELCQNRDDLVYLGYDNAVLKFANDKILLHHIPTNFKENNAYDNKDVISSIKREYIKMNVNSDSVYLDLLGHVHKSSLSLSDGYAMVPSLNKDRYCNGAWHLKIFFDSNLCIEKIIFMPLIFDDKIIKTSEIVYQKTKKFA